MGVFLQRREERRRIGTDTEKGKYSRSTHLTAHRVLEHMASRKTRRWDEDSMEM